LGDKINDNNLEPDSVNSRFRHSVNPPRTPYKTGSSPNQTMNNESNKKNSLTQPAFSIPKMLNGSKKMERAKTKQQDLDDARFLDKS
jgi:hypothetical protein